MNMIPIMHSGFFQYLAQLPSRSRSYAARTVILNMDDPVDRFCSVKSGLVHLVRMQEDGGMVILQRAVPGAIIAEASVFSEYYHCSAIAVQDSVVQIYPLKQVQSLLEQDPLAAKAYAKHLANEVRTARRRAEILALRKVSDRLDAWLTWNNGLLPDRGVWHHVADEIGISKEALYRELALRRK